MRDSKDYEVIRIGGDCSYDILSQAIKQNETDVVIINPGHHPRDLKMPLRLMHDFPGLKVLTLNLECSSVDMYNKQIVWMNTVSDLLDLVKKGPAVSS